MMSKLILGCASNTFASLDPQKDDVIEVKGSASNVSVSWDEKNEEGAVDESEKATDASGQMMDIGKDDY